MPKTMKSAGSKSASVGGIRTPYTNAVTKKVGGKR